MGVRSHKSFELRTWHQQSLPRFLNSKASPHRKKEYAGHFIARRSGRYLLRLGIFLGEALGSISKN
jgi:hypothetical protein